MTVSENNGVVALTDALARTDSVKRDDLPEGSTFRFVFPAFGFGASGGAENYPSLPEVLPPYSRYSFFRNRDIWLLSTPHYEGMWANVVATAVTKAASWAWSVESSVPLRRKRMHEIFRVSTAGIFIGWAPMMASHIKGYVCAGIGVVEIERERSGPASRVKALHHLNPLRCIFTDDPEVPVVYQDRRGEMHEMKAHQVMLFPDMADTTEGEFRLVQSSAERAYRSIGLLAGVERYLYEKITGKRPQSLYFITGLTEKMLLNAVQSSEADANRKGHVIFRGAAVTPIPSDQSVALVEIPLAELPDGFDAESIRANAYITYANAVGLDINDIDPRLGQKAGLGTGLQSLVLQEKASGKGLAYWRRLWEDNLNLWVTDAETTFRFSEQSTRDKQDLADLQAKQTETIAKLIEAQIIDAEQAKNLAVDAELLPREFIEEDRTGGDTLSSDDKPETESEDDPAKFIAKPPPAAPAEGAPGKPAPAEAAVPKKPAPAAAPQKVATKHLRGQHDQSTHGSGGVGDGDQGAFENELRNYTGSMEFKGAFAPDGRQIFRVSGEDHAVTISRAQADALDATGGKYVDIHNHPNDTPPSPADYDSWLRFQPSEARVVGKTKTFILRPKDGVWFPGKDPHSMYGAGVGYYYTPQYYKSYGRKMPKTQAELARNAMNQLAEFGWLEIEEMNHVSQKDYSAAAVMLPMPAHIRAQALSLAARVSPFDLHEDGIETDPHVTVLYGAAGGAEAVSRAATGPIELVFGDVSLFTSSDEYDVLKIDVDGDALRALHEVLPRDKETEQRPIYHPHLTIAYVRPGTGRNYTGRGPLYGQRVVVDTAVYSDGKGEMTAVPLGQAREKHLQGKHDQSTHGAGERVPSEAGEGVLYHGTIDKFVDSIREGGLKPGKQDWGKGQVFATRSKSEALKYALLKAESEGIGSVGRIALFEIDASKFKTNKDGYTFHKGTVPPDAIRAIHVFKPNVNSRTNKLGVRLTDYTLDGGPSDAQPEQTIRLKEEADTVYVAVIVTGEDAATKDTDAPDDYDQWLAGLEALSSDATLPRFVRTYADMDDASFDTESLKHGEHDQKRHGWRFGSNATLSGRKRIRKEQGEDNWEEYKRRQRARTAGGSAKPEKEKKPGGAAKPRRPGETPGKPGLEPTEDKDTRAKNHIRGDYDPGLNKNKWFVGDDIAGADDVYRGEVKAKLIDDIHARLPADSGISKEKVNMVVELWSYTSNDDDTDALAMQTAVSKEFGVPLSDWQKMKRSENGGEDEVSLPLSPKQRQQVMRAMYENTQAELANLGYKPGDTINLYRGMQKPLDRPRFKTGTADYTGNAMESWSTNYGTAKSIFSGNGGNVFSQQVPIENILSTARTGYGCLTESEFVIFGVPGTQVEVIYGG